MPEFEGRVNCIYIDPPYNTGNEGWVETKGDDRDNSHSKAKLKLGLIGQGKANEISHETGYRYHYMKAFDNNRC